MGDEVRPLRLAVPERDLDDLRDRLRRTRFPEPETVGAPGRPSWDQGPPLAYVAELVRDWSTRYDWRRLESELNDRGQALTEIDGLDVHLLHVRSSRPDAVPLVISHGWPGSVVEVLDLLDALTDPPPHQPAFHVVAPSLPGFGFSGRPSGPGWTAARTADAWAELMSRLGYERFCAVGGDWGGRVTFALAQRHPDRVAAIHTFTPYVALDAVDPSTATADERSWFDRTQEFRASGGGYSLQQATRPQTVAYALVDSPVAQLTWVLDKLHAWTDHDGDVESAVGRDRVLDLVSMYWLPAVGGSSARFYWQNHPPDMSSPVDAPTSVTVFPVDIENLPRRWVETRFSALRRWSEAPRGGHFPMLEVPDAFAGELRAAFAPEARSGAVV